MKITVMVMMIKMMVVVMLLMKMNYIHKVALILWGQPSHPNYCALLRLQLCVPGCLTLQFILLINNTLLSLPKEKPESLSVIMH